MDKLETDLRHLLQLTSDQQTPGDKGHLSELRFPFLTFSREQHIGLALSAQQCGDHSNRQSSWLTAHRREMLPFLKDSFKSYFSKFTFPGKLLQGHCITEMRGKAARKAFSLLKQAVHSCEKHQELWGLYGPSTEDAFYHPGYFPGTYYETSKFSEVLTINAKLSLSYRKVNNFLKM